MLFKESKPKSKIIPMDSRSAVTVFKTVRLERPNPREELTLADLENSLAQAVWKFFDRLRFEAADRLRINEADLLLADVRVTGMKIDGHQVINPEGFTGHSLEFTLCLSLVRRDSLPVEDDAGTVFEEGSVRAHLHRPKHRTG